MLNRSVEMRGEYEQGMADYVAGRSAKLIVEGFARVQSRFTKFLARALGG